VRHARREVGAQPHELLRAAELAQGDHGEPAGGRGEQREHQEAAAPPLGHHHTPSGRRPFLGAHHEPGDLARGEHLRPPGGGRHGRRGATATSESPSAHVECGARAPPWRRATATSRGPKASAQVTSR
jgi:hypothetical protein